MAHWSTAGRLATFNGTCVRCDEAFTQGVDQVVRRGPGRWIHAQCASGADE